jgi:hypothetical protein
MSVLSLHVEISGPEAGSCPGSSGVTIAICIGEEIENKCNQSSVSLASLRARACMQSFYS